MHIFFGIDCTRRCLLISLVTRIANPIQALLLRYSHTNNTLPGPPKDPPHKPRSQTESFSFKAPPLQSLAHVHPGLASALWDLLSVFHLRKPQKPPPRTETLPGSKCSSRNGTNYMTSTVIATNSKGNHHSKTVRQKKEIWISKDVKGAGVGNRWFLSGRHVINASWV